MDINNVTVGPKQLAQIVSGCIAARAPIFVWGSPGVGKSSIIKQVCDSLSRQMIDIRAAQLDPVDLRGIPWVDHTGERPRTRWSTPEFLPVDSNASDVIFADELNAAARPVQVGFYQLILDRALGEYTLPENVSMIGAGNLETDGAVVYAMSTALASRFVTHVELVVDDQQWAEWAVLNGLDPVVVQYIRMRPDKLHDFDPKSPDRSFPCPRTWEYASKIIGMGQDYDTSHVMLCGCLGRGAATEFAAFRQTATKIQSPAKILSAPDKADVPSDPALMYATIGALARKATTSNIGKIMQYGARLQAHFNVLLVLDAKSVDPTITRTKHYRTWCSENQDVF